MLFLMPARFTSAARLLPLLLGLAACQGTTDSRSATTAEPAAAAQPTAARDSTGAAAPATGTAAASFIGYHRYVGTVGKAPVVLELTINAPDTATNTGRLYGSYYYERQGAELRLEPSGAYQPGQPLTLLESSPKPDEPGETTPTGRWRATQPAGPVLSGTWESADGRRRLPFQLREDYQGAVRYELLHESSLGTPCPPIEGDDRQLRPEASQDFLHLLGPDTLRPALRALQCPGPRPRRAEVREALAQADCEGTFGFYTGVEVVLNGYGLLSVLRDEDEFAGGAHPNGVQTPEVYDLGTGRALKLTDWLRPGQEAALDRLLLRRLRAHPYAAGLGLTEGEADGRLPALGFDSEGAYCTLGDFGAPHVVQRMPVVVPYRELRPLVQPGSVVARMLQRRGLW